MELSLLHELFHAVLAEGQYLSSTSDEPLVEWLARCTKHLIDQKVIGNIGSKAGYFNRMPRVESFFNSPTGLKIAALGGTGADIGQGILAAHRDDNVGLVKNTVEAGLGGLNLVGLYNLYQYLPSRYRARGQRIDLILDKLGTWQSVSSLF